MSDPAGNTESGIGYQADLPLKWQPESTPGASALASWQHANVTLLRALSILETAPPEREHDADSHLAKSLDRLEAKLDIALSLMSRLAVQNTDIPQPVPVTLTSSHLEWSSSSPLPAAGELALVSLYLSDKLPEPLRLHVRVIASADGKCLAEIVWKDEEFNEWLTRTLFRYHRRELHARHHA